MLSYNSSFYSNEQITEISEINNDLISLPNSEDKNNSYSINFQLGFQENSNYINDEDDIKTEKIYFNKDTALNSFNPCDKKDNRKKKKYITKKKKKNSCIVIKIALSNKGRKNKNSNEIGKHDKFSFDNILKKIKTLAIRSYLIFLNKKINYIYRNSNKVISMNLEKINQKQVAKAKIDFNREYFNMTFKDIFSEKITTKFKYKERDHNKNIINKLLKEKDEEKRKVFICLLNFRLIDIVKYLRGEKDEYAQLNGLGFEEMTWKGIEQDKEYLNCFKYYMMNIETILLQKNSRNRNNKK